MNLGEKGVAELMSMSRFGSRYQVELAVVLIAIVPMLSALYIVSTYYIMPPGRYLLAIQMSVTVFAAMLSVCGYVMLRRYPTNIERLRYNLRCIVEGELPQSITLIKSEDDIKAIENYMNMLLEEMRGRIKELENQLDLARRMKGVIQSQAEEILAAERHRVMIQSLGAACHHMGQPLTVLQGYLDLIKKEEGNQDVLTNLGRCQESMNMLNDVLNKLRHVSEYRTVPYQTFRIGYGSPDDRSILDIDQ